MGRGGVVHCAMASSCTFISPAGRRQRRSSSNDLVAILLCIGFHIVVADFRAGVLLFGCIKGVLVQELVIADHYLRALQSVLQRKTDVALSSSSFSVRRMGEGKAKKESWVDGRWC